MPAIARSNGRAPTSRPQGSNSLGLPMRADRPAARMTTPTENAHLADSRLITPECRSSQPSRLISESAGTDAHLSSLTTTWSVDQQPGSSCAPAPLAPAEKLPPASRITIVPGVLALVAAFAATEALATLVAACPPTRATTVAVCVPVTSPPRLPVRLLAVPAVVAVAARAHRPHKAKA